MAIIHIVLFQFKPELGASTVDDACQRMLALKTKCVRPDTGKSYIKSLEGGKNNSPEGRAFGLTHGFVVVFENEEDRQYYVDKDPAHLEYVQSLAGVATDVRVLDYTPGVF